MSKLIKIFGENNFANPTELSKKIDEYVNDRKLENIIGCTSASVWDDFCEFCDDDPPCEKQQFHKRLMLNYPLSSKSIRTNGCVRKVIVGIDNKILIPREIVDFVNHCTCDLIVNCTCDVIWNDFCEFCGGNPPITKMSFHKFLNKKYNLISKVTSIEGKTCRVLVFNE